MNSKDEFKTQNKVLPLSPEPNQVLLVINKVWIIFSHMICKTENPNDKNGKTKFFSEVQRMKEQTGQRTEDKSE